MMLLEALLLQRAVRLLPLLLLQVDGMEVAVARVVEATPEPMFDRVQGERLVVMTAGRSYKMPRTTRSPRRESVRWRSH